MSFASPKKIGKSNPTKIMIHCPRAIKRSNGNPRFSSMIFPANQTSMASSGMSPMAPEGNPGLR